MDDVELATILSEIVAAIPGLPEAHRASLNDRLGVYLPASAAAQAAEDAELQAARDRVAAADRAAADRAAADQSQAEQQAAV